MKRAQYVLRQRGDRGELYHRHEEKDSMSNKNLDSRIRQLEAQLSMVDTKTLQLMRDVLNGFVGTGKSYNINYLVAGPYLLEALEHVYLHYGEGWDKNKHIMKDAIAKARGEI